MKKEESFEENPGAPVEDVIDLIRVSSWWKLRRQSSSQLSFSNILQNIYSGEKPQGSTIRPSQMSGNYYTICNQQFWWKLVLMKAEQNGKGNESASSSGGLHLPAQLWQLAQHVQEQNPPIWGQRSGLSSISVLYNFLCGTILNICFQIRNNKCGCKGSPTGGRRDWRGEKWGKVEPTLVAQVVSKFLTCPWLCNF